MIGTGSGEKRVELDEIGWTIDRFLQLTTGKVAFLSTLAVVPNWLRVLELVQFCKKYECAVAISHLEQYVRVRSEDKEVGYMRLLVATHLDLKHDIAAMIEKEPEIFEWLRPSDDPHCVTRLPPYDLFRIIPQRHLWALMSADVSKRTKLPIGPPHDISWFTPGERFLEMLAKTEQPTS